MTVDEYVTQAQDRLLEELFAYLRIPSVSTDPARADDTRRAAEFTAAALERAGLAATVHESARHPIVTAVGPHVPDAPTVLVYGHYDVQPPDPIDAWTTSAFEPHVRDGVIVARGASDDKGQVYAHIKGVEALLAVDGGLPLNVKFVIEGEEEIGSPNLPAFLEAERERLAADVVVISDGAMVAPETPTITYGLKGLAYATLFARGAGRDLHSGAYGGGVPNVLNALAVMLASLHDADGRVAVEGFYDDVKDLDDAERAQIARAPFSVEGFMTDTGVRATPGERGYTLLERLWARPTLDVNGLSGGFQGNGSKTVIAAEGMAKLSARLVPNQDPHDVFAKIERHLLAAAPEGIDVRLQLEGAGKPAMTPLHSPSVQAAGEALRTVWGKDPVFARSGGTIPVVAEFQRVLGAHPVLIGFGLESDRAHSPNEKFDVVNYLNAVRVSAELLRALARSSL
jgi:acetylornithine deacetylase/succinyl-diaminopimelate desuccinylase-like protein